MGNDDRSGVWLLLATLVGAIFFAELTIMLCWIASRSTTWF